MTRLARVGWVAGGCVVVWSLTLPAALFPANRWPLHTFRTPEIGRERVVAQEFVMTRDGLDTIAFHPVTIDGRPGRRLDVRLIDVTEGTSRVVRNGHVDVTDAAAARTSYRFEFQPIADSRNRRYSFEVAAGDGNSGIALLATRGDPYEGGTLRFNGRSRWADLRFRATAPTTSIWQALRTGQIRSDGSSGIVLVLIGINWILVAFLLGVVTRLPDPSHEGHR